MNGEELRLSILEAKRVSLGPEWSYEGIQDPFSRLYYIHSGSGSLRLMSKQPLSTPLSPGRLYLIPAYMLSSFWTTGHIEISYLHFSLKGLGGLSYFSSHALAHVHEADQTESLMERIITDPLQSLSCGASLLQLVSLFTEGGKLQSEPARYYKPCVLKVLQYIDSHLEERLSVTSLAAFVGLDPSYLSRCFSSAFDLSLSTYIMRQKIERSIELLACAHSQKETAELLGFSDVYHFSKSFKQVTGTSPGAYMRLVRSS